MPDLVLIDGGKGHLNAAVEVFLELGIDDVPLASLAKEREEIFVRDTQESIMLPRSSPALFLVQRLRDEAHRFAVTYHQRSRTRKGLRSAMDVVPGIGPKAPEDAAEAVRFGEGRQGCVHGRAGGGAWHDPNAGGAHQGLPVRSRG